MSFYLHWRRVPASVESLLGVGVGLLVCLFVWGVFLLCFVFAEHK